MDYTNKLSRRHTISEQPLFNISKRDYQKYEEKTIRLEHLSVRSHSPPRVSAFPEIKHRSKSFSSRRNSSPDFKPRSRSFSTRRYSSPDNDLFLSTTTEIFHRQRKLSGSGDLGRFFDEKNETEFENSGKIHRRSSDFGTFFDQNNNKELENPKRLHRRSSLPPLASPDSMKSQQNLADKYYQKWRENKFPKKPTVKKSKRATEHPVDDVIIEEGTSKLSMQKNVHFSPEFEQVFKDLSICD